MVELLLLPTGVTTLYCNTVQEPLLVMEHQRKQAQQLLRLTQVKQDMWTLELNLLSLQPEVTLLPKALQLQAVTVLTMPSGNTQF
jgi:hypothetical protein